MQGPATPVHEGSQPAPEGGAGGLPQFDIATWPGQAAWLVIFFVVVLVLMTRVFVPRIGGGIAERERKISGDVREARRLKAEADAQAAAAQAEMAQARAEAMKFAADARGKAQAELAGKLAEQEAKFAEAGAAAEARIAAARETAMSHLDEIARDAAGAIVAKLTGKAPTAAELASARGA